MQVQIQALLAAGGAGGAERGTTGPKVEVATPAIFNGEAGKVGGFVTACRLYLRMKMREVTVEEQVFWVLSHVQGESADVWKENVLEELEAGEMEYEKAEERKEEKEKEKKKKPKKGKTMKVRKVVEEWEIWNEEEEVAKSEEEAKKLVLENFHRWIKVFGKKQSERMPTRKLWDHVIDIKEGFMLRKGKVYPLSREEREEVREFVKEQLWKGYIRLSKSPQTVPVFFVGKKDRKKRMVQDY